MNYFSTGFHLFVYQEVIKRYLKISRNFATTHVRQKSCKEKMQPSDGKKSRKHFIATKYNKMNNKKKRITTFTE